CQLPEESERTEASVAESPPTRLTRTITFASGPPPGPTTLPLSESRWTPCAAALATPTTQHIDAASTSVNARNPPFMRTSDQTQAVPTDSHSLRNIGSG